MRISGCRPPDRPWLAGRVSADGSNTDPVQPMLPGVDFPDGVPILTDGHVLLRAHTKADLARIVEQCRDPESIHWTTVPLDYGRRMARGYLAEIRTDWQQADSVRSWAIVEANAPGTFLGTIDIRPRGAGIAEVGFGLHPHGRHRHLMTGALRLAARWWFDQGGIRLTWTAFRANFASWRVAHACGFTFHGVLPEYSDRRGEATSSYFASVGRDDDLFRPVTPWHEAPVLENDGVRLRAWRDNDIDAMPESDSTPLHYLPPGNIPTRDTFPLWLLRRRERVMTGGVVNWCITDPVTDTALGAVVLILDRNEPGAGELGYFLFESARGRGLASAAAGLATGFALRPATEDGLGLRRLVAVTVGDNEASARVLEKLGFTEWGREPQACARVDDTFDDARHWALLPHGLGKTEGSDPAG